MVYLLITCVASVWGMIIYKIYLQIEPDKDLKFMPKTFKKEPLQVIDHSGDDYSLVLNRDPFQNMEDIEIESREQPSLAELKSTLHIIAPINWPTCSYDGYVNNANSRQKIALVSISGKTLMMKEGETQLGIQLIKNYKDSIKLSFQKQIKFVHLK